MQTQMQTSKPTKSTKPTKETPAPVIIPETEIAPVTAPSTAITTTETDAIEAALGDTVATQTMPTTPNPRDLVGADVFFVLPHNNQRRPGTVTFDHETEGQLVDITVFTRGKLDGYPEGTQGHSGVIVVHNVSYAPATDKTVGTWHWRTERA